MLFLPWAEPPQCLHSLPSSLSHTQYATPFTPSPAASTTQDLATIRELRVVSPRYFSLDIRGDVLQRVRDRNGLPTAGANASQQTLSHPTSSARTTISAAELSVSLSPQVLEQGTLPLKLRLGALSYAVDPTGECPGGKRSDSTLLRQGRH